MEIVCGEGSNSALVDMLSVSSSSSKQSCYTVSQASLRVRDLLL